MRPHWIIEGSICFTLLVTSATAQSLPPLPLDFGMAQLVLGERVLAEGRFEEAVPHFRAAVEAGLDANQVVRRFVNRIVDDGIRRDAWDYALRGFAAARRLPLSGELLGSVDYWQGFALYQTALVTERPQTPESAREALPMFQDAKFLMAMGHRANLDAFDISRLLVAIDEYIERQQEIVQRAR